MAAASEARVPETLEVDQATLISPTSSLYISAVLPPALEIPPTTVALDAFDVYIFCAPSSQGDQLLPDANPDSGPGSRLERSHVPDPSGEGESQVDGDKTEAKPRKPRVLRLNCSTGKAGSRALRHELPKLKSFFFSSSSPEKRLTAQSRTAASPPPPRILIACMSGGRDIAVGVALAVLCLVYDEAGTFDLTYPAYS